MNDFTFFNPTRIEFGADKEQRIGQHLAEHGIKKVLLCYGSERIKREGLFAVVSQRLSENGIEWVELGGIVSNPVISKVREGIALAKQHQVDAILSVGGGSVLDSAKAIAAGVCYAGDVWDLFVGKASVDSALPLFAILTLAATGSEMNLLRDRRLQLSEPCHRTFALGAVQRAARCRSVGGHASLDEMVPEAQSGTVQTLCR